MQSFQVSIQAGILSSLHNLATMAPSLTLAGQTQLG